VQIQIKPGVTLTVIPVSQFKNTQVSVHFLENASKKETSYRSLLANILETSSQKYRNQILVSQKLSQLYGAGFGTSLMRKQNVHDLMFSLALPNDHYLASSEHVLDQGLDFLQEMIFNPLTENGQFHGQTYQRQQRNLVAYINALKDDKQSYAALQLQQLYFGAEDIQSVPTFGDAKQIAEIPNQALFEYYQKVLAQDRVEIFVVGDVVATQVQEIIQKWPLSERTNNHTDITRLNLARKEIQQKTEEQMIVQSKLDLAYQFPTNFRDETYYAGIVFNALFGGSPLSKLFLNVREKASLAYYATSNVDVFNGLMVVQTGINAQDKDRVLTIIDQQLKDIQNNDFSDDHLAQIKTGLISNYIGSLDAERSYTSRALTNRLVGSQTTTNEWVKAIQNVSRLEIVTVANQVQLQAIYFLSSGAKKHA